MIAREADHVVPGGEEFADDGSPHHSRRASHENLHVFLAVPRVAGSPTTPGRRVTPESQNRNGLFIHPHGSPGHPHVRDDPNVGEDRRHAQ